MIKTLSGTVVSTKMSKTAVVEINRFVKHPQYHKYMRVSTRFLAHDENNECQVGDKVTIQASRPFSKKKTFIVVKDEATK
jgi:small subunit ribosomal protein S17